MGSRAPLFWPGLALAFALHACFAAAEPSTLADSSRLPIPSCEKIAFIKNLKTGSTTFANILYRMAASRDLRAYKQTNGTDHTVTYLRPPAQRDVADVVMSHITGQCIPRGDTPALLGFYEQVTGHKC